METKTDKTKKDEAKGNSRHIPDMQEVIAFCKKLNLAGKVVGKWVWVFFEDKPEDALRQALKDFGFRWSARRGGWAHNCGHPSRSAAKTSPFEKYQVTTI